MKCAENAHPQVLYRDGPVEWDFHQRAWRRRWTHINRKKGLIRQIIVSLPTYEGSMEPFASWVTSGTLKTRLKLTQLVY